MSYRIAQEQAYQGNNYWSWSVWIEADPAELDRVEEVTWYLHHTFPQPVVHVKDRASRFALKTAGWGMFQLNAELRLAGGTTLSLTHWLELSHSGEEAERTPPTRGMTTLDVKEKPARPKQVFLSFGSEDARLAAGIKNTLVEGGFSVLDAGQVNKGEPLEAAIHKMIRESDLVLGLVTSDFASPYLVDELNAAQRNGKPAAALTSFDVGNALGLNQALDRVDIDPNGADLGGQVLDLARRMAVK